MPGFAGSTYRLSSRATCLKKLSHLIIALSVQTPESLNFNKKAKEAYARLEFDVSLANPET